MSQNIVIKDPVYIDLEKTRVGFKLVKENGTVINAELKVPADKQRGVNAHWDYILDNYDIEAMRKARNDKEILMRKENEWRTKKAKAVSENEKLRRLFDKKMKVFELPFINAADDETKSAIRRAPTEQILDMFVSDLTIKYIKDNNLTYAQYLDYLEDLEDAKEEQ